MSKPTDPMAPHGPQPTPTRSPEEPVLPPDDPNKPFVNREPSIDPPRLKPPMEAPSEKPGITEPPRPRARSFGMSALVQGRRRASTEVPHEGSARRFLTGVPH